MRNFFYAYFFLVLNLFEWQHLNNLSSNVSAQPEVHGSAKQTANGSFPPRMSSFKQSKTAERQQKTHQYNQQHHHQQQPKLQKQQHALHQKGIEQEHKLNIPVPSSPKSTYSDFSSTDCSRINFDLTEGSISSCTSLDQVSKMILHDKTLIY